ncbi:MAG: hypothetical protein CL910_04190 [Deltaproteobacteria bacterium]|nr:hypothetical protein [Deltaproteobacteria bacterium]
MLKNAALLLVPIMLLSACVAVVEDGQASSDQPKKTTLGRAQGVVQKRIDRLRFEYGKALLASIQEIISFKAIALEPIRATLPGADARTRANLIYALGYIGGTDAHRLVANFTKDESEVVRYESAAALMGMGDWSAVPVLIGFLENGNRRFRYKAWQVLQTSTRQKFGYDFDAVQTEREPALARWRSWWNNRRQEIIYGENEPTRKP